MSAPIIRRLPGFVRSFSSTSFTYAAAPAGRPYVRKSAVPTAILSASATSPASAPSPAPTSTSIPTIDPIDLDDIPTSSYDVDDLPRGSGQSSTPIASAPLTSYPDFSYKPLPFAPTDGTTDWATSFSGMSQVAFSPEARDVLLREVNEDDVECKPDGILYYPEIKYRRVLNRAFGPGAWGMAPRGEPEIGPRKVSREWGLVCLGRLVAVARGEQEYFDPSGISTAQEGAKSNALMRCCKDLGIASELWDPNYIRKFKNDHCVEVFCEHAATKKKKKQWRKKNSPKFSYPWSETK